MISLATVEEDTVLPASYNSVFFQKTQGDVMKKFTHCIQNPIVARIRAQISLKVWIMAEDVADSGILPGMAGIKV